MSNFNQKEYQTVLLGALLHVGRSRFIGDELEEFKNQDLIFKIDLESTMVFLF